MRRSLLFAAALAASSGAVQAQFVNGGFENGTASGWTAGGGYRAGVNNAGMNPTDFLPGGSRSQASNRSAVVTDYVVPDTDGNLRSVYSGTYAYRLEDQSNGGFASVVAQRVNNWQESRIFFAWAAVLEGAHGTNDAALFKLLLRNVTTGQDLISRTYTAATGGGGIDNRFTLSSSGHYYTRAWQIEELDVSAYLGNDLELILLAADCQPTGHSGFAFIDGFGAVAPPPGDPGVVPEPSTYALMVTGLAGLAAVRRRRNAARPDAA